MSKQYHCDACGAPMVEPGKSNPCHDGIRRAGRVMFRLWSEKKGYTIRDLDLCGLCSIKVEWLFEQLTQGDSQL